MSLIHKNASGKLTGKRRGSALHPLPSVSASPRATPSERISTDVEDSVDRSAKPQVRASLVFPLRKRSERWIRP